MCCHSLTLGESSLSHVNVFVPKSWVVSNEVFHQVYALLALFQMNFNLSVVQPLLSGGPIVDVFSYDDARDFVEDGGARAHLTGAESRDQDQFVPVVPPARV